jgi:hypothetical protein
MIPQSGRVSAHISLQSILMQRVISFSSTTHCAIHSGKLHPPAPSICPHIIIFRIVNVFRPVINLRFFQHVTCTFLVDAYPSDSFINLAVSIKRYCRGHLLAATEPTPSSACESPINNHKGFFHFTTTNLNFHYCRCAHLIFHSHRFHRTQQIRPQTRAPTPHFLCTTTHTPTLRPQYRTYLQLNSQFLHQIHVNDQV